VIVTGKSATAFFVFLTLCVTGFEARSAEPALAKAAAGVKQIIAHRGASSERPECTLSAIRRAIEVGATAVEVDVRTSQDGKLFILHDTTLDRTTNGKGPAANLTLAELQKLDAGSWFDVKYKSERIPSLIESARACRGKIDLLLDLKEQGDEYDRHVASVIRKHGDPKRTIVGVRSVAQTKRFRKLLPEAKQLALIPSVETIEDFANAGADVIRIWPRWLKDGDEPVKRVRATGKGLHLNGTSGELEETSTLLKHRPTSLLSDDPRKLLATLEEIAGKKRPRKKTPPPDSASAAGDWPMWRRDAGRTAVSSHKLPADLSLRWVRHLPPLRPAYHSERLQFDAGYEPVVSGGLVIVGSSRNDSVTAFDELTGTERWRFFTDGPVRFAPAVWNDRVFFGSDDGCLYCVKLESGELIRKFRAVPSRRKLLGNKRMISVWPVRGGPVVADDRVYFAAGVWPMEGVFVYCLDAETGKVVWLNDRLGHRFGKHPHGTEAIGGLAPQGYLVVNGDELVVPCSTAYPATLDRRTGKLIDFELPTTGRFPGGWFAALDPKTSLDIRRGRVKFDDVVNRQLHEDKVHKGHGDTGISRVIKAGDRDLKFDDGFPGVEGKVHSMLTAQGRLFVVTREGSLYCFDEASRVTFPPWIIGQREAKSEAAGLADPHRGYALVVGLKDGVLVRTLAEKQNRKVVAIESDGELVAQFRAILQADGLYGTDVAILHEKLNADGLPPYFADVITTEDENRFSEAFSAKGQSATGLMLVELFESLRPFGGTGSLPLLSKQLEQLRSQLEDDEESGLQLKMENGETIVTRTGALPGSTNYRGGWQENRDQRVRFPLGVLWFDDTLGHFKRSPQPQFVDGVMASYSKDWHVPMIKGLKGKDYPLNEAVLSDVYTGRVFGPDEATGVRAAQAKPDREKREPSQYRPPYQKNDWSPAPPRPGRRVNPLTGLEEPRAFPKTYGCDGGVDYGNFFTMRSGTAAFYDKTLESGTVFISGPRSGCTNSIIPANGVLNVPYYYEGCTCSYPLPVALSLVPMPERHEQWASWGEGKPEAIERIGINFGAPGDRTTRDGTLWLDYPSTGGPSPSIDVAVGPESTSYRYRHSVFVEAGRGWPWIVASSAEGLAEFTLKNVKPGSYTVRLYFAETGNAAPGERIQSVSLQGESVGQNLDIAKESGGSLRGLVREFTNVEIDGTLSLKLTARKGRTLISGVELIRDGLKRAEVFEID
jgi:glycerophosphoryl diester phosphodiesterase/outer membrane protein assembly factor BamB